MAQLKIKIKGLKNLYLTREYNSLSVYDQNKDDVGFNDTTNDFSTYCLTSSCGNPALDKIKILTLPAKGRLFYRTNPAGTPAAYAAVTVGQEILVSDMIMDKVLKFNAEGSMDGAYTDNYLTTFTFERYCGATVVNETVVVNLNMLDLKTAAPTLTVANVRMSPLGSEVNETLYDLTVTGEPWTGNVIAGVTKGTNCKIGTLTTYHGDSVLNTVTDPKFVTKEEVTPITIPVGFYPDCSLQLTCVEDESNLAMTCDAYISYSQTLDYTEGSVVLTLVETQDDQIPE